MDGFLDGIYAKVIPYWWGQHAMERLRGPTYYHLMSLELHELPILLTAFAFVMIQVCRHRLTLIWAWALVAAIVLLGYFNQPLRNLFSESTVASLGALKIRDTADILVFLFCFVGGVVVPYTRLKEGKIWEAFLYYWTFANFAIFSYAGEKGPWLTPHIAFPMIILVSFELGLLLERWYAEHATVRRFNLAVCSYFIMALALQGRLAVYINHVTDGQPTDALSQVHNHRDVKKVVDWMLEEAYRSGGKPESLQYALLGEPTWAFYFYVLNLNMRNHKLSADAMDGKERFVIGDEDVVKPLSEGLIGKGYRRVELLHNGWYVPSDTKMSWGDWLYYFWRRQNPNVGTRKLIVFFK